MTVTTISSRQFNQDAGGAKKAARRGPVFITDRGQPAHVLLSIEDYRKLVGEQANIVKMLAMKQGKTIEFEPVRLREEFDVTSSSDGCTCLIHVVSELRKPHANQRVGDMGAEVLRGRHEQACILV